MYTRFYNLTEPPFRLTPDPRYLFLSAKHREALAHLMFTLRRGSGFAVIAGEIGTGKTTLIRTLLRNTEPDTLAAYIFNPTLSALELLQAINQEFGLPVSFTTKELMDSLNRFLLEQKRIGKNVVVIIDEAQALAPEVLERLRLLSNLETETEKLLQIILVGQPELMRTLLQPQLQQLKQRIEVSWHLRALGRQETAAYVRHRLSVASAGSERRIFTTWALGMIHSYSGGIPRAINMICDRALLIGYTRELRRIGVRAVRRAVLELAVERAGRQASLARSSVYSAAVAAAVAGALLTLFADTDTARRLQPHSTGRQIQSFSSTRPVEHEPDAQRSASAPTFAASGVSPVAMAPEKELASSVPVSAPQPKPSGWAEALIGLTRHESRVRAVSEILKLWKAPPLDRRERQRVPLDLNGVAARRGLQILPVSGTWERLRSLDLPAILELVLGEARERRWVSLVGEEGGRALLVVGDEKRTLALEELDPFWLGDALVVWRDYEALPQLVAPGSSGPQVLRLQDLLRGAGVQRPLSPGYYDEATEQAVAEFQRRMGLAVDGIVGPLTKIFLYQKGSGYFPPKLREGGTL